MPQRVFFVDTDTATDDAVALLMVLQRPDIEVVGISTVAGNCSVEQATQNALFVRDLVKSTVAVHVGADAPLAREWEGAHHVHGRDGMGDIDLPLYGRAAHTNDGVGALIDAAARWSGQLELVTLGPLTNLALALAQAPELVDQLKRVVVMGGTAELPGNVTPLAEYNFWADPEAAHQVAVSGLHFEMAGWDIATKFAAVDPDWAAELRSLGPLGKLAFDIQGVLRSFYRIILNSHTTHLPDPLAMAIALEPDLVVRVVGVGAEVRRHVAVVDLAERRGPEARRSRWIARRVMRASPCSPELLSPMRGNQLYRVRQG